MEEADVVRQRRGSVSGNVDVSVPAAPGSAGIGHQVSEPVSTGSHSGSIHRRNQGRYRDSTSSSGAMEALHNEQIRMKTQALMERYNEQLEHFQDVSSLMEDLLSQTSISKPTSLQQLQSQHYGPAQPTGGKSGKLLNKKFYARPSLLTELFEIPHIQTIHYIFIAVLLIFSISTILNDLMFHGTLGLDFKVMRYTFGKLPHVMTLWLAMQVSTLVGVYLMLCAWAKWRERSDNADSFDCAFLGVYLSYQIAFLILPVYFVAHLDLPPASTAIVVIEQIRFLMKSHAFVREKAYTVFRFVDKTNTSEYDAILDFSKYIYFQFVPTLVYRDTYPRTKRIRWNFVLSNLANVFGAILYAYYVFVRFCIPVFRNFNHLHVNPATFVSSMFSCILPGALLFVVMFFALLHCWMNAFAEMLRFADRMFYKDWWNSTNFSNYYRTWNVVVHDWLHSYMYKDLCLVWGSKYRHFAMTTTFLVSAAFHEYVFCCMFRFFYPVLFVMFAGIGVWLMFATQQRSSPPWSVLLWALLMMGLGMLMCLYTIEYYARFNCPPSSDNPVVDYLVPRSWTYHVVTSDNSSTDSVSSG